MTSSAAADDEDDDDAGEGRDRIPNQPLDECEHEELHYTVNTGVLQ